MLDVFFRCLDEKTIHTLLLGITSVIRFFIKLGKDYLLKLDCSIRYYFLSRKPIRTTFPPSSCDSHFSFVSSFSFALHPHFSGKGSKATAVCCLFDTPIIPFTIFGLPLALFRCATVPFNLTKICILYLISSFLNCRMPSWFEENSKRKLIWSWSSSWGDWQEVFWENCGATQQPLIKNAFVLTAQPKSFDNWATSSSTSVSASGFQLQLRFVVFLTLRICII